MATIAKKLLQVDFSFFCEPVLPPVIQPAAIKELRDNVPNERTFVHARAGTIGFAEGDGSHAASFTALGSGYLGAFRLGTVNETTNKVGWAFKVKDGALDFLQAGQTLLQNYRVTVDDGNGRKTTETIKVKIVGTNDAPVITTPFQLETINENTIFQESPPDFLHVRDDVIRFKDVDLLDTHTTKITPLGTGYVGTMTLGALNQTTDTISWTFQVADKDIDLLDDGDQLIQRYRVSVDDGHGGIDTTLITIVLNGAQDFFPA
jgi:VCBS repeat-containing protein